jgi:hypothetical protein
VSKVMAMDEAILGFVSFTDGVRRPVHADEAK